MKTFTHHIINSIQSSFGRFQQVGVAACALALLVATGASALAQSSGKTRPHHGIQENFVTPTAFGETYVAPGKATHLGKFVSYGINFFLGFNADGLFHGAGSDITVAANGDETWSTWEWTLDVSAPMEEWVVNVTWVVVGGTGRFENATGEGTSVGRFNAAGNFVFINDGVINY
ncbi:MAG: hypothetical protein L0Z50_10025 [Verrucomicrobiales bacterium]|nr:hypothetical protein [Verrucomicrobiales bacterium]